MGIFDRIFGRQTSRDQANYQPEGMVMMCSGCMDTCSGENAHVIPWWNESAEDYLTTFRCENCWLTGLDETKQHVADLGENSREKMAAFVSRHGLHDLADTIRSAPWGEAKSKIDSFLNQLREKEIVLSP